eukprot:1102142-Prorocentrum_minimum.AAC.3
MHPAGAVKKEYFCDSSGWMRGRRFRRTFRCHYDPGKYAGRAEERLGRMTHSVRLIGGVLLGRVLLGLVDDTA